MPADLKISVGFIPASRKNTESPPGRSEKDSEPPRGSNETTRLLTGVRVCDRIASSAGMMELADMQDLGSCVARRWGSSPHARTKIG